MNNFQEKSKLLRIKPHHFLDIIKLHGGGYEKFTPDKVREHAFWSVGNEILENPNVLLELTEDNDDICEPCKFNGGFICTDMTTINTGEMSKDGFNKKIDRQLLKKLGLAPGATISAIEFCKLAKKSLSADDIAEIWKEKPDEETKRRIELLFLGIEKYLEKF